MKVYHRCPTIGVLSNTIVKAAEDLALNYTYDPDLAIEDVHWYDAKNLQDGDPILTYDPQFRKPINRTYSAIHLPTDIWKGDPKIANELKWSDKLDEVFYANTVEDPGLLWQYFGSSKGPFRNYPAFQWESPGTVDLFDVRRRPCSGSVHGLTLTLIKRSVQELLKTLGENDFVNMAWFNTEAHYVSCFDTFVQANVRNKKVLEVAVLEIGDGNMSDFGKGLEFAFRAFDDFNANSTSQGARCNKIIMLFTDGGTERPVEVFEKYNKDRDIRIFTYAVGPPAYSTSALKWMACENKGYYVDIPAVGAIRQKTQDYVAVLSRPMVLSGEKQFMWTNIYLDAMGMGMMTTITLPVYNKSEGSQEILGVMGTDITLAQITKFNPNREVGPTGYTFAINPNGYILFHPSLKSQLGYLSEPPNVDFLEVEPDNPSKEEVRKNMIDRMSGAVTIETFVRSQDERYVDLVNRTYIYGPMNSTIFSTFAAAFVLSRMCAGTDPGSVPCAWLQPAGVGNPLGLVLPEYRQKRIEVENIDIPTGRDYLQTQRSALFIAPWNFCDDVLTNSSHADFLQDILEKLSGFDFPAECDEPRLKHLLLDTVVTERLAEFWNNKAVDFKSQDIEACRNTGNTCNATCSNARYNASDGIVATFVSTEGGITRVFPESECQDFEDKRDTWQQTFFRRSLDNDYFIYSVPYNSDHQNWPVNYTIMATSSVTLNDMGGIKPAVVGVKLDPEIILGTMLHITDQCSLGQSCSDVIRSCRDSENLLCVLLDDGGFIVTTNQDDQVGDVGRFFGEVDGHLMSEMYNQRVYRRILFSSSSTMAEELGEEGSIDENVSCVRLQHEYYLGPTTYQYWSDDCGNCSRGQTEGCLVPIKILGDGAAMTARDDSGGNGAGDGAGCQTVRHVNQQSIPNQP
ncbi:Voltage-dependent calcium channel subunit alpha-2/delta-1, partial [Branchiostoma belcheri]